MATCCSAPTSSRTRASSRPPTTTAPASPPQFNLNVLHVINRELGANFDVEAFEHVAFFDREREWIEMRLRALDAQHVRVEALDLDVDFAAREELRTEISAKFTRERLRGRSRRGRARARRALHRSRRAVRRLACSLRLTEVGLAVRDRLVLVGRPETFDRKRHGSGGDQQAAFGLDEALVAVRSVAVADVVCHRLGEGVPVGVVGVVDDELADRPEVAFDAV